MKRPAAAPNRARAGPAARAAAADDPAARAAAAADLRELEQKAKAEMMEEAAAWSDSDAETLKFGGARSADANSPASIPDLRQPTSPALRSPEPNRFLKQCHKIRQLARMDKGDLKAKGNKDDDKEENNEDAGQERKMQAKRGRG